MSEYPDDLAVREWLDDTDLGDGHGRVILRMQKVAVLGEEPSGWIGCLSFGAGAGILNLTMSDEGEDARIALRTLQLVCDDAIAWIDRFDEAKEASA